MTAPNKLLDHAMDLFPPPPQTLERVTKRQALRSRNRRLAAGAVALAIAIAGLVVGARLMHATPVPAVHPTPAIHTQSRATHNGPLTVFGWGPDTGDATITALSPEGVRRGRIFTCGGDCAEIRNLAWSPDGTRIAFSTTCDPYQCKSDPYHGIHVVDLATGQDHQLLKRNGNGFGSGGLDWSPDGTRIAYVDHSNVFVMSADGSRSRLGSHSPSSSPVRSPGPPTGRGSWSPVTDAAQGRSPSSAWMDRTRPRLRWAHPLRGHRTAQGSPTARNARYGLCPRAGAAKSWWRICRTPRDRHRVSGALTTMAIRRRGRDGRRTEPNSRCT